MFNSKTIPTVKSRSNGSHSISTSLFKKSPTLIQSLLRSPRFTKKWTYSQIVQIAGTSMQNRRTTPPPCLSLARGRRSPAPPTCLAAAPALLPQIGGHRGLRRLRLSLLAADRLPEGRQLAGIDAPAPADRRRVRTLLATVRRPKSGGAATCRHPAAVRVLRPHARFSARPAAAPASSTPPQRSPAVRDVIVTSQRAWAAQRDPLLGWAGSCAALSAFFFPFLFYFF